MTVAPSAITKRGAVMLPSTEPGGAQVDFVDRPNIAVHLAADRHGFGHQIRPDSGRLADGEAVASELDRALDVAVDGEILLADDFAFDADGLADPRDDPAFGVADFVGHVMTPP